MQELEYNYQSKYQLVKEPLQSLPHKCAGCNRESSHDPQNPLEFVDWNLEVEFFGKIFICTDCLREMCNQMGYANPAQVAKLEHRLAMYDKVLNSYDEQNQELKNALGSLGVVFSSPVPELPSMVPDEEDDDITLGDSEGETGSTEQATESGSTDVPSDESDDLSDLI